MLRKKNSSYAAFWAEQRKLKIEKAKEIRKRRNLENDDDDLENCTFKPNLETKSKNKHVTSEYDQKYLKNFHYKSVPSHKPLKEKKAISNILKVHKSRKSKAFDLNESSIAQEFASFSSRREKVLQKKVSADFNRSLLSSLKAKMTTKTNKRLNQIKHPEKANNSKQSTFQIPEHVDSLILMQCHWCLRKFREDRVHKHEKACEKHKERGKQKPAFQSQTKRLSSILLNENDKSIYRQTKLQKDKLLVPKRSKKWKLQSDHLRKSIKPSDDSKPGLEISYVNCKFCGRSFNEQAAARHIPKCKDQRCKPKRLLKGGGNNASCKR